MKRVLMEMMGLTEAAKGSSGFGWQFYGGRPKPGEEFSAEMDNGADNEEDFLSFSSREAGQAKSEITSLARKAGMKGVKVTTAGREVKVEGTGVDYKTAIKFLDALVDDDFFITDGRWIPQDDDFFHVLVVAQYEKGGAGERWQSTDPRHRGKPPYGRR